LAALQFGQLSLSSAAAASGIVVAARSNVIVRGIVVVSHQHKVERRGRDVAMVRTVSVMEYSPIAPRFPLSITMAEDFLNPRP